MPVPVPTKETKEDIEEDEESKTKEDIEEDEESKTEEDIEEEKEVEEDNQGPGDEGRPGDEEGSRETKDEEGEGLENLLLILNDTDSIAGQGPQEKDFRSVEAKSFLGEKSEGREDSAEDDIKSSSSVERSEEVGADYMSSDEDNAYSGSYDLTYENEDEELKTEEDIEEGSRSEYEGQDYQDEGEGDAEEEEKEEAKEEAKEEEASPPAEELAEYARKTFHQSHIMPKHMLGELKVTHMPDIIDYFIFKKIQKGGTSSHMTMKENCTKEKQCPRIQFFCDGWARV